LIEDVVKRALDTLPRYGATYWALLAHPVDEVLPRSRQGLLVWDAVLFWSVSLAIYVLTRYLAFGTGVDSTIFVLARGLSFMVQLLLVSLAFFVVWRLFGARYSFGSFLIATACFHGIVLPLEAVFNLTSFGAAKIMDEQLFQLMVNSINGCGQVVSPDRLQQALNAFVNGNEKHVLPLLGLYLAITMPILCIYLAYGFAFFRVLAGLAEGQREFGRVRISLMLALGCCLAVLAASFTGVFDWILFHKPGLCIPDRISITGG